MISTMKTYACTFCNTFSFRRRRVHRKHARHDDDSTWKPVRGSALPPASASVVQLPSASTCWTTLSTCPLPSSSSPLPWVLQLGGCQRTGRTMRQRRTRTRLAHSTCGERCERGQQRIALHHKRRTYGVRTRASARNRIPSRCVTTTKSPSPGWSRARRHSVSRNFSDTRTSSR